MWWLGLQLLFAHICDHQVTIKSSIMSSCALEARSMDFNGASKGCSYEDIGLHHGPSGVVSPMITTKSYRSVSPIP